MKTLATLLLLITLTSCTTHRVQQTQYWPTSTEYAQLVQITYPQIWQPAGYYTHCTFTQQPSWHYGLGYFYYNTPWQPWTMPAPIAYNYNLHRQYRHQTRVQQPNTNRHYNTQRVQRIRATRTQQRQRTLNRTQTRTHRTLPQQTRVQNTQIQTRTQTRTHRQTNTRTQTRTYRQPNTRQTNTRPGSQRE